MTDELTDILNEHEYHLVLRAASRAQDDHQLPLVAWMLGFISLDQLAKLLGSRPSQPQGHDDHAPTPAPQPTQVVTPNLLAVLPSSLSLEVAPG